MVVRIKRLTRASYLYTGIYVLINILCFIQYKSAGFAALIITVLLISIGFFIPYTELGVYLFTCLPFFNIMNTQVGSTSLYYILTGIAALRYLSRKHKYGMAVKIVLLCLFVAATCYNLGEVKEYVQWIIRIIPLILFFRENFIRERMGSIINKYTLSMLISSFWGWLMLQAGTSIYTRGYVYNEGEKTIRLAGLVGDSVVYGIQLIFLVSFLLIFIYKDTNFRKTRIVAVALLCWFGMMTYSKTFLAGAAFELLFIFFYWNSRQVNTLKTVIRRLTAFLCVICAISAFIYYILTSDGVWASNLRARLFTADMTTGRLAVWKYYMDKCFSDWVYLFRGIGFSEYFIKHSFTEAGRSYFINRAHNLYLETAVIFGVLEMLVLTVWMAVWAFKAYGRHRDKLYYLPLFMLILTGMTTHGHFEYHFYLNVLLVLTVAESGNHVLLNDTLDKPEKCEAIAQ